MNINVFPHPPTLVYIHDLVAYAIMTIYNSQFEILILVNRPLYIEYGPLFFSAEPHCDACGQAIVGLYFLMVK